MIAWLVAGQGAEHAGMGLELAQAYPPAAVLWEQASEAARKDLRRMSELGGRSLLRTEYLQPALTVVALSAASFLLEEGVSPSVVLGHSAGEVGALALSGHLSFEDACRLSAIRGRAMASAARSKPGGMAVVRGSEATACDVVEYANNAGDIFRAGQTTEATHLISGDRAALLAATSLESVARLPVSGPWHSPLIEGASLELRPTVESILGDGQGTTRWVSNETAEIGPTDAAETRELLLSQLTRPMRLHGAIERLFREGATDLVVLGPHRALRQILLHHLEEHPEVEVHSTSSLQDLRSVVRELA